MFILGFVQRRKSIFNMVSRGNNQNAEHERPKLGRQSIRKFITAPSFFTKINEEAEVEPEYQPSSFAQIYKNAKYRLSRSLKSRSASSQV